mmetsp:Transcript_36066/g.100074  ORF Transcript_36066/g.100074 Transcript_36066/m.100074 type:complete len:207 (-) Transcript_36066:32-652(-)
MRAAVGAHDGDRDARAGDDDRGEQVTVAPLAQHGDGQQGGRQRLQHLHAEDEAWCTGAQALNGEELAEEKPHPSDAPSLPVLTCSHGVGGAASIGEPLAEHQHRHASEAHHLRQEGEPEARRGEQVNFLGLDASLELLRSGSPDAGGCVPCVQQRDEHSLRGLGLRPAAAREDEHHHKAGERDVENGPQHARGNRHQRGSLVSNGV